LPGRIAHQAGDAADIDDAAAALLDQRAFDGLDKVEGAFQVRVQHDVPVFRRHAHAEAVAGQAGVIYQDIDAREVGEDLLRERFDCAVVGDIDGVSFREPANFELISSAVRSAFVSVRLTTATRAPSLANRTAIAWPIPRPAPVTMATWLANLIGPGSLASCRRGVQRGNGAGIFPSSAPARRLN
jgi:hypothetical protein